ncbi:MAG TPA: type II CAAX endopeptidase family protein [Candidatus Limnocylindria bacterium]|nr:type II CAAX endopeptidase family protein [Candidatus Limnocylindria bacterium]
MGPSDPALTPPPAAPPAGPEPVRWPWVAAIIVGGLALLAAATGIALVATRDLPASSATAYLWMAGVGAVLALIGLIGLALRAIRVKRTLPPERYRGPSVFVLLFIVLVAGNLLSAAFLLEDLGAVAEGAVLPALSGTLLLLLTPIAFTAAVLLFVLLPNALAGFRLTDGPRTVGRLLAGAGLGVLAWVGVAVLSLGVEWVARQLGQPVEGQQLVADLLANVHPAVAIVAASLVVPFGEELFFRGVALNAWEREYGPRRGLWGSALLFTAIHVPDGGYLVVAPILVLSLVLGVAYQRTRSLPLVVGLHGAFNAVSTVLLIIGS